MTTDMSFARPFFAYEITARSMISIRTLCEIDFASNMMRSIPDADFLSILPSCSK